MESIQISDVWIFHKLPDHVRQMITNFVLGQDVDGINIDTIAHGQLAFADIRSRVPETYLQLFDFQLALPMKAACVRAMASRLHPNIPVDDINVEEVVKKLDINAEA